MADKAAIQALSDSNLATGKAAPGIEAIDHRGVNNAFLDAESTLRTGVTILFDTPYISIYNEQAPLVGAAIILSVTGALKGSQARVYFDGTAAPTSETPTPVVLGGKFKPGAVNVFVYTWNGTDFERDIVSNLDLTGFEDIQNGILTGGAVTINADPTKYDVAAGTGVIIDWTTEGLPIRTPVSWLESLARPIPDITKDFTNVFVVANGTITDVSGVQYTPQDRRIQIQLQSLTHVGAVNIDTVSNNSVPAYQKVEALMDYILELGPLNKGNTYSANIAADLTVDKASGSTVLPFINRFSDTQNPTIEINAQILTATIVRVFRDGAGGFTTIGSGSIDPNFFDDGSGTLVAMSNNKYQIQRGYFFGQNNLTVFTYGQATYNSIAEAEAAIFNEAPVVSPLTDLGTFTTASIIEEGTTDLTNASNAKFVDISTAISSGSAALQNVQQVYNNSLQPQLKVSEVLGPMVTQSDRTLDSTTVTETKNKAGDITQSVNGDGDMVLKDAQVTGEAFVDEEFDNGDSGTTETIDWTVKNFQESTLTDDVTFTFTDPSGPTTMILRLIQDATGTRLVTWPGSVKWPGGTAPTLTTDAMAVDLVTFYFDGANYNGSFILDVK